MGTFSGSLPAFDGNTPEMNKLATDSGGISPYALAAMLNNWQSLDAASVEKLRAAAKYRYRAVARSLYATIDSLTAAQLVNLMYHALNGGGWPDRATEDGPAS